MKKLLTLLVFIFMLNSCDDGDLTVDTINFDAVTADKCGNNNIVYKLNGSEILLVEINETGSDPYANVSGTEIFNINTDNRVRYRLYNGAASINNICETLQPATPSVVEEWIATAGSIEITTTAVYNTPDPLTGAITIFKYNHSIVFKNIIFAKPEGNQIYETYTFGIYQTNPTPLPFNFTTANLDTCNSKIYNISTSRAESIVIENIDPLLIQNTVGTLSQPISATINKLVYHLYASAIPLPVADYFCPAATPATPAVTEEWIGVDGITNVSGLIEVTTTTNGTGFSHTIRLKKVTFKKGATTFYYGDDILYGDLLTN